MVLAGINSRYGVHPYLVFHSISPNLDFHYCFQQCLLDREHALLAYTEVTLRRLEIGTRFVQTGNQPSQAAAAKQHQQQPITSDSRSDATAWDYRLSIETAGTVGSALRDDVDRPFRSAASMMWGCGVARTNSSTYLVPGTDLSQSCCFCSDCVS